MIELLTYIFKILYIFDITAKHKIVELLIKSGSDVNSLSKLNETAVFRAVNANGISEIIPI